MPKNTTKTAMPARAARRIADPETLLAAAEEAPSVFNMATHFRPVFVMRQKGYSWRHLGEWLRDFNIEISPVHLRRLYVQEDKRLSKLSAEELAALGLPQEMIDGYRQKSALPKRRPAADSGDDVIARKRREALRDSGVSEDEIARMNLSQPVKIGINFI